MAQSEHIIKNYDMLLSHGETKTRKVALDIAEAAIQRAIPYHETLRLIRRTPNPSQSEKEQFSSEKLIISML